MSSMIRSTGSTLPLTVLNGTPLVDTRTIATGFGVEHESTARLVDKYSDRFQEFGILRFEIGEIKGRGQPERFYLLNEDQTYFLLTLTRNTVQVVDLKHRLVQAFSEFRKVAGMVSTTLPMVRDLKIRDLAYCVRIFSLSRDPWSKQMMLYPIKRLCMELNMPMPPAHLLGKPTEQHQLEV